MGTSTSATISRRLRQSSGLFGSLLLGHLALETRKLCLDSLHMSCVYTHSGTVSQQRLSKFLFKFSWGYRWNSMSTSREAAQQQQYAYHNCNNTHVSFTSPSLSIGQTPCSYQSWDPTAFWMQYSFLWNNPTYCGSELGYAEWPRTSP